MRHAIAPALLSLVLAAAFAAPGDAQATYRDTSAGGACHAASGANSASFSYSNNFVTNVGGTTQFLICHFAMDDASATPTATTFLKVAAQSTQAGTRIVSCSAQTGSFYSGTNYIHSNSVASNTFSAPGYASLNWTETLLVRNAVYETFTLNCRLDPGTRIGIIEYRD